MSWTSSAVPAVAADPARRLLSGGGWIIDLTHVAPAALAKALAHLHQELDVGAQLALRVPLAAAAARDLVIGGGFERLRLGATRGGSTWLSGRRAHTLPDWIRPRLDLLICGLNPSLYAADSGIPFGRPGNRFWPAALRAQLVTRDREPFAALERGLGFTDCAKRTTRQASELRASEYADGFARVSRQVRRYRPRAVCFVGLDSWRRVIDPRAQAGWTSDGFAGRPCYLMPSTSGLNAHIDVRGLSEHLRRAARAPR